MMLLAHSPHNRILIALTTVTGPRTNPPPGTMTQTLSTLHRHPRTRFVIAPPSRRAVGRTASRDFDRLVAARFLAELAFGAVGDADPPLDDAVGARGDGALAADAAGRGG